MKIKIDKEKCYKSGECYYNHPELFQMGDDGFPELVMEEVTEAELVKHATEASEVCPAGAIVLEE